jgi:very-short-patch-repair endonuclease
MTKEEKSLHTQSLRSETLKMSMTILDSKKQREIENQQLLPPGRQKPVESYTTDDVIASARLLLEFITSSE